MPSSTLRVLQPWDLERHSKWIGKDAERPKRYSHAERGNEKYFQEAWMPPSVSVIVPVRNEARSIERTLRLLLTQDFPRDRFEVIVADGASTDETVPIVRR